MEDKKERAEDNGKISRYVRLFFAAVMGLLIVFTIVMTIYRKFVG
jgi:hypothetical protein